MCGVMITLWRPRRGETPPAGFEFTPQLAHFPDCVAGLATPKTGVAYARHLMAAIPRGYEDEAQRARRTLL